MIYRLKTFAKTLFSTLSFLLMTAPAWAAAEEMEERSMIGSLLLLVFSLAWIVIRFMAAKDERKSSEGVEE